MIILKKIGALAGKLLVGRDGYNKKILLAGKLLVSRDGYKKILAGG